MIFAVGGQKSLMNKTSLRTAQDLYADFFMGFVFVFSILAITGWVVNKPILAALNHAYIPMAPGTALIFLGLWITWFIRRVLPAKEATRIITLVLQVGMLIIVLILVLRSMTGLGPDLENIIYPNPPLLGQIPTARMSPLVAAGLFLAIPGMFLATGLKPNQRVKNITAGIGLALFTFSGLILIGYLYGAPLFYGGTTIPVALPSALTFFFLSLGLLMMAGRHAWPMKSYNGHSLRARLLRAFIPSSILIVLFQGLLSSEADPWIINPGIKVAVAAIAASLIVVSVVSLIVNNLSADFERGKKAEEALRKSESSLQAVLQSTVDGILAVGSDNEVLYTNDRFAEIWRIPREVLASRDDSVLLQSILDQLSDPQTFLNKVQELYKSDQEHFDTLDFKDGRVFERRSRPLMNGAEVQGRVWTFRDITEGKRSAEALVRSEAELRALFASMQDVVIVYDINGHYIEIAPTNPSNLFRPPDEMLGKTLHEILPKEQADINLSLIREAISSGKVVSGEYMLQIGGKETWFSASTSRLSETTAVLVAHDITNRKRSELVQNAIYRITQASITGEGIDELYHSIHSILGELIRAENFYIALYDQAEGLLSFPYYVDQFDEAPPEPTPLQGLTGYVIRTGLPLLAPPETFDRLVREGEVEVVGTTGVDWMGAPLKLEGRTIGVMAIQSYTEGLHFFPEDLKLLEFVSSQVAQVIERKRMEQEIVNLSLKDELTGLNNRRGFSLLAEHEMKLAYRFKRSVSLFFCDLDGLKTINDTYGHAEGDEALKEVSAIIKETFREADIPARFGGDEFVILAPDTSVDSVDILPKRLQATVENHNHKEERPYRVTLSVGIARFTPDTPHTINELISQADELMYQQKKLKKGV
jgi:diguanylate cyclase (GGDEF)-like protein/PAS domain S-box-containing protein